MKARYRLIAPLIFGAISAVSYAWLRNINYDHIFLTALTALSGAAAAVSLAAAVINIIGNRSDGNTLHQLNWLKKFITIMLILAAITFLAIGEGLDGGNTDSEEDIYALFALMCLFPTEIAVMIVSAIIYCIKKKRYNADTENTSEDISNETQL